MPPKASKPASKRKAPAFKPPLPTSKKGKLPASRRKSAPIPRGRRSLVADQASASEDDDDDSMEDQERDEDEEDDEIPSETQILSASEEEDELNTSPPARTNDKSQPSTQDPPPTIPPALLTRLLHHHFKDSKSRIGKDANGLVGKYMETFVREAICRAAFERSEAVASGTEGLGGDFLEVYGF